MESIVLYIYVYIHNSHLMFYLAFENEMETWPILKNSLDTFYTFLLHIFWNKSKNFILSFYCCEECFWFHVIYAFMYIRSDRDRKRVWICDIKWGDGVKVWVLFLPDKYLNCLLNEDFFVCGLECEFRMRCSNWMKDSLQKSS